MPSRRRWILFGLCVQLIALAIGGYLYTSHRRQGSPSLLVHDVLVPEDMVYEETDVQPQKGANQPPVDLRKAAVSSPEHLREGEAAYKDNCLSCHGPTGKGDGPASATLNPKPRNMTSLEGWKQGTRLSDIFRTITRGIPSTPMPAFDYLTPEQRFSVAHFVVSLGSGHPADTGESMAALDREFKLSEGRQQPSLIPVSMAMERLAMEAVPAPPEPDSAAADGLARAEPRGAAVYSRVVLPSRLDRVAYLAMSRASWRQHPDSLRVIAVAGAPADGFSSRAAALSADDWAALTRYLALRYPQN
jgi:mono/diheme cytochrome c family protein